MAPIDSQAVDALFSAIESLLPSAPRSINFSLLRMTSTGLGGFVGIHDTPTGDIIGRVVEAKVQIDLRPQEVTSTYQALLNIATASLRQQRFLKLKVDGIQTQNTNDQSAGLTLDVIYEYLHLPEESEGIIETIPINMWVDTDHSNLAPRIVPVGDQTNATRDNVTLPLRAVDPEKGTLTFSAVDLPPGLNIDTATGEISGRIARNSAGIYDVTVTVRDDGEPPQENTASFIWTVT